MRFAILGVDSRRNNTIALSLPVRHLTEVIDDDVASLSCCLWTHDTLHTDNFPDVGLFSLEGLQWNV